MPSGAPPLAARIAVVEDEANLRESIAIALGREGFLVEPHGDGGAAWSEFERSLPDVVILDILLPRIDGLELCRRLRRRSQDLPILFLSSRDEEFDRVLGLELGADDYLCKPFSMRELVARVRVLLRRRDRRRSPEAADDEAGADAAPVSAGRLALDTQRFTARLDGRPVDLTVTEFLVLLALARRPGHVRSRRQLVDAAYAHDAYVAERTIDSHVKRIRRKLADATAGGTPWDGIETVHGLGYRLREAET